MTDKTSLDSLRQRPHWSFSSINGLVEYCSLKWAFQRVYREEPMFTPVPLVFGKVYHGALTFAFGKRARGESCTDAECAEVFADLLSRDIANSEPEVRLDEGVTTDTMIDCGRRMIAGYLQSLDPDERIHGVAVPFSVPLRGSTGTFIGNPLIGEFDLVVQTNMGHTIVDWKTAARRWPGSKARVDLQPTCYLYAHHATTGREAVFRFDVVTKAREPVCENHFTTRTVDDFDRLVGMVATLERLVQAEAFIPRDGSWECKSCPYSLACQSWHRERASTQVHFLMAA